MIDMAENGLFRVALRGFHKQDVLQYIDELQKASAEREAAALTRAEDAEQALAAFKAQQTSSAEETEKLKAELEELRSQNEKITALAQIYKREMLMLREQVGENETDKTALETAQQKIVELEDQCAVLKEQTARYAKIVGDVSSLVVEARVVSSSYLDVAHQKSTDCIKKLDTFLSQLREQADEELQSADARRRGGEQHIETLLSDLQDLGVTIKND